MLADAATLRSKTPQLIRQEVEGLMMAHFATRKLLHGAARSANEDPDRLSFIHAVSVIKSRVVNPEASLPEAASMRQGPGVAAAVRIMKRVWRWMIEEVLELRVVSSRGQKKPRGVRRKMSNYPLGKRGPIDRTVHDWTPKIVAAGT